MTFLSIIYRLTWFFAGPAALLMILIAGSESRRKGESQLFDLAYFGVMLFVALTRVLDQRSGLKQTARGEPSTWKDVRQYITQLLLFGSAAWAGAYFLGKWM
ncbi:MAG TPA: hypothetical protein VI895_05295 [Bdellovibrionota bacterium]|nr:hypothetical protein [Bdellovibrionota bacterium]